MPPATPTREPTPTSMPAPQRRRSIPPQPEMKSCELSSTVRRARSRRAGRGACLQHNLFLIIGVGFLIETAQIGVFRNLIKRVGQSKKPAVCESIVLHCEF